MVKIIGHGNLIEIVNPITHERHRMRDVIFLEQRVQTHVFMDGELLDEYREHTMAIHLDKLDEFAVNKQFDDLYINHHLYSTPQTMQQQGTNPRMINGRPTYIVSSLEDELQDDLDYRISNEIMMQIRPESFMSASVGDNFGANVPWFTQVLLLEQAKPFVPKR